MVNFYVKKIRRGEMTLEEVPHKWQEAVRKILEKN